MAKTPNLGLNITTDETTLFEDWRRSIDGEDDSNMQIIDNFAGEINAKASLKLTNIIVSTWIADTSVLGMNYKANITITGITVNDLATVVLAQAESISGNYASINDTSENTVTIYSKVNTTITIPTIWVQRS